MPIDKSPIVVKEFKGILGTDQDLTHYHISGSSAEPNQTKIPFEYAFESINLSYLKKGGLITRDGIDQYVLFNNAAAHMTGKPHQMWRIDILNNIPLTDRWLILTWDGAVGRLYDTGSTIGNPIMILAGMKYAYVINVFSRMYISPWSAYAIPLQSDFVYVYNGLYTARRIKATSPVAGAFAGVAAAGGSCTPGLHYVSVLFETDTGYISVPPSTHLAPPYGAGPYTPISVTTTAANATISLNNIPVGAAGSGVVKRHIIVTKVVINPPLFTAYGSGLLGFEPFIAYTINDNVTAVATVSIPDSGLLDSAKIYLIDNTTCPSCVAIAQYGNRLVYLGPRPVALESSILVSPPSKPEQIKTVYTPTGILGADYVINDISTIYIAPNYSGQVMAGAELNGVFYVFKEDSTWAIVTENDKDPTEWTEPACIDSGKGAYPFGVASIGNNPSNNNDSSLIVCGSHGITFFNGRFAQRSLAEAIWESYSTHDLKWSKLLVEPIRQVMFLHIGDPASDNLQGFDNPPPPEPPTVANRFILMASYYYGIEITNIRWSRWFFLYNHLGQGATIPAIPDIALRAPGTQGNDGAGVCYNTLYSLLSLLTRTAVGGLWDSYIYSEALQDRDFMKTLGVNAPFPNWQYDTGYTPNEEGTVFSFGPLKVRLIVTDGGVLGLLTPRVYIYKSGLDSASWQEITPAAAPGFTPDDFPGKYYSFNMNHVSEHVKLRLYGQNRVLIDQITLYRTEVAKDRPRA